MGPLCGGLNFLVDFLDPSPNCRYGRAVNKVARTPNYGQLAIEYSVEFAYLTLLL